MAGSQDSCFEWHAAAWPALARRGSPLYSPAILYRENGRAYETLDFQDILGRLHIE